MRVFRVLVGMVLLSVAAPALLAGAVAWYGMQHRDPSGEFRARIETVAGSGYAVVVPDLDALLRRDVPFARAGRTTMRITARALPAAGARGAADVAATTPLFVGLAAPGDAAALLAGSAYAELSGVSLGRGPLDARTTAVPGVRDQILGHPEEKPMWERSGVGELTFDPSDWRGKAVALVVLAPDGARLDGVALAAAVRFGWLDSTTWGLLILGPVLLLLGFVTLAWPARQVVYVVADHRADHRTADRADGTAERAQDPEAIRQVPSRHVVAGPAYAGPTMVTWMDAPTMEVPVMARRPGLYVSTFAATTTDVEDYAASEDHAGPGDHAENDVIETAKGASLEDGLSAEWMTADAPPKPGLGTPQDWMRPQDATARAEPQAATTAPAGSGEDGSGEEAGDAELQWPPAEEERRTPPAVDVPTQEMHVLDDLPYVPLQFAGGERAPRLQPDRRQPERLPQERLHQ